MFPDGVSVERLPFRDTVRRIALAVPLLLLPVLMASPCGAETPESLSMEMTPAWEGRFLPGSASELGVRLVAGQGGPFELSLKNRGSSTLYRGVLEADAPLRLWLPISPAPASTLSVELLRPGHPPMERELPLQVTTPPLDVVARDSDGAGFTGGENANGISVPVSRFPRTPEGYGPVRSLTVSPRLLAGLDPEQSDALGSYLLDCGTLILTGAAPETLTRLRNLSGCGGRFVGLTEPMTAGAPSLPSRFALASLPVEEGGIGMLQLLGLMLFTYAAVLFLLERALPDNPLLLVIPVAATLAIGIIWQPLSQQVKLVSWAEMESGDPGARYTALLTVGGGQAGERSIPVARELGLPKGVAVHGGSHEVEYRSRGPETAELRIQSSPFTRQDFWFRGAMHMVPGLVLKQGEGAPVVVNNSAHQAPAGLFSWKGRIYAFPPLDPERHWSPSDESFQGGHDALITLMRSRTDSGRAALLMPYSLDHAGLEQAGIGSNGWLLLMSRVSES